VPAAPVGVHRADGAAVGHATIARERRSRGVAGLPAWRKG